MEGPATAYMQQWTIMRHEGIKNPKPREQFVVDMIKFITEWQEKGYEIVLGMDANEPLGVTRNGIHKIIQENRLTDAHMEKYGGKIPETYERGKEKIDHILVTERIYTSIRSAGMTEYHEAIQSDHRALFIDIDFEKLTGGETT